MSKIEFSVSILVYEMIWTALGVSYELAAEADLLCYKALATEIKDTLCIDQHTWHNIVWILTLKTVVNEDTIMLVNMLNCVFYVHVTVHRNKFLYNKTN